MTRFTSHLITACGVALTVFALAGCETEECIASEADAVGYRNPETGLCEGGGGGGTDCGSFGGDDREAPGAQVDMAMCFGACEGLDEQTCLVTSECRGVYAGDQYLDCWGTSPSGPAPVLACEGLDAWSCQRTDHCSAVHAGDGAGGAGNFVSCRDEKVGCTSGEECGGGTCSAETECLAPPGGSDAAVCYGFCEDNPPGGPGSCSGEIDCAAEPPECPSDTLPGRADGCWTGYCIPVEECDAVPECESLGEAECASRSDCTPSYRGQDCVCDPSGCSCEVYVFDSCGVDR